MPPMPRGSKKLLVFCWCLVLAGAGLVACTGGGEQFIYSGFAGANLTLDGAAAVTPEGQLELTNGTAQKAHAIHPAPFRFREAAAAPRSFSASFVFGILCSDPYVCGHGIVLFVAPGSYNFSAAFPSQYIGLVNNRTNGDPADHIFGVELDTSENDEFHDINSNHVGIDVNSLVSVESSSAGYYGDDGAFHNLTLVSGEAMQLWIDYNGESKQINVALAPLRMAKPTRPLISTTYDLSMVLTDMAYVGFSSATGALNSRHYILGWSFAMNGPAPAIDVTKLLKLPRSTPKHGRGRSVEVIITPIAFILFVVGTVAVVLISRWQKYAELREDWEIEFGPHRFTYKDLFHATDGFNSKNLLGVGGFGCVYKGILPASKSEVAVKRVSHDSKQGVKEFIAEVVSIGRLQHRNLVQLLGYCRRKGELLLVYEFMSNGSLDKHLHVEGEELILDWDKRIRIIRGIASGLFYLHEEWEKVIIHRDVKASNVLLDDEMNGRLGDFGLARLYDHGGVPQTTHVIGTIGYLAPELGRTCKASPLTDVFAFGVFLLEVTCGQRPIRQNSEGDQFVLVDWVVEHWLRGSLTETMDPKLHGNFNIYEACLVLKLGLLCSHPLSATRPTMRQVVRYLNGDMPLPEITPTHQSFGMLTLLQNQGFDSYVNSYPSSMASITDLSREEPPKER